MANIPFLNNAYFAAKVGIGKPVPTKPLDVIGNAQITGTLTVSTANNNIRLLDSNDNTVNFSVGVNGKFQVRDVAAGTNIFQIEKGAASDSLYIDEDGKVGIGTAIPDRKLHVKDSAIVVSEFEGTNTGSLVDLVNSNASQLYNGIRFTQGTSSKMAVTHIADGTTKGYVQIGNSWATGSEILVVDGRTSNVGIGTTTPTAKLDVDGVARVRGGTYAADIDTRTDAGIVIAENDYIYTADTSSYLRRLIGKSNDIIKIGESATSLIDGIDLMPGTTGGYVQVFNNNSVAAKFVDGKLGIGTTSPSHKLEIGLTSNVALSSQPAIPLLVSNNGQDVDGRVFIQVKNDLVNTASAVGAGLQMTAAGVTSGTASYENSLIFLQSKQPGNQTIHSAPQNIKFYVDNDGTSAGAGANYSDLGDLAFELQADGEAIFNYNVGIGTTSPTAPLHVDGGTNSEVLRIEADSNPFVRWVENGTNVGFLQFLGDHAYLSNMSNGSFFFRTNNTDKMTILAGGNVGVGTTSPDQKLQIEFANSDTSFSGGSGGDWGSEGIRIENTINTVNTMAMLHFRNNDADVHIASIRQGANDSDLGFFFEGSRKVTFKKDGKVGIGTITPSQKLQVAGNLRVTGAYYDSNNSPGTSGQILSSTVTGTDWVSGSGLPGGPYLPLAGGTMTGTNGVLMPDNFKLKFGDATTSDIEIYHNGTNSYIDNNFGHLYIRNNVTTDNGKNIYLQAKSGENGIIINDDSSVQLYNNNILKLQTSSTGVTVTGTAKASAIEIESTVPSVLFDETDVTANWRNRVQSGSYRIQYASDGTTFSDYFVLGASANTIEKETTFKGDLIVDGARITIDTDTAGNSLTWRESDSSTTAGQLRGYGNRGDIYLYDSGVKKTELSSQADSFIPALHIGGTAAATGGVLQTTGNVNIDGSADISATVTATTFSGDLNGTINTATTGVTQVNSVDNTTIATTAYVNNKIALIPAGLVFQGTWNAATNTPTLASGTGTTGHFYIVSVAGSTNLDGITDWKVGDWAVFIEQGASDQWEKIDNSSVLDGIGTGQTLPLWSGSGTSNTLTDSLVSQPDTTTVQLNNADLKIVNDLQTGGNGKARIKFSEDATTNSMDIYYDGDGQSGDANYTSIFSHKTGVGDVLVTTYGGNVGIGTTSPGGKLDIAYTGTGGTGTFGIGEGLNISAFTPNITFNDNSSNVDNYAIHLNQNIFTLGRYTSATAQNPDLVLKSGNVGIGTATPSAKLEIRKGGNTAAQGDTDLIVQDSTAASSTAQVQILGGATGFSNLYFSDTSAYNIGGFIYNHSSNYLATNVNGSEKMRIDSSGNVGIGISNPVSYGKFVVQGTGSLINANASSGAATFQLYEGGQGRFAITTLNGSAGAKFELAGNEKIRIDSSGNVGIGATSPTYKLDVVGGIQAGGKVTYSKSAGPLTTTGYAVAGLTAGFNGASAGFEFKCYGGAGKYQRIVYSCYGDGTTWRPKKVIDEGTNDLDVSASADGTTITFTYKATSASQSYSPRIIVEATGHSINSTYA